jgi:tetratricopeptide (TPR) repeat protein
MVSLVEAKGELQRGEIERALQTGRAALRAFEELGDTAGQMMTLDHVGYCAEILGDLATAAHMHQRALELARSVDSPIWRATQLTRLGSVQSLIGQPVAIATLRTAAALAESVGSSAGVALAENGLGLAHVLTGDMERAIGVHATALAWYEQQGSSAGMSYTAGRLAQSLATSDSAHAVALAQRSLELARITADPRAVAHALEAVAITHDDAAVRARALGGARALRRRTRAPLPHAVGAAIGSVQRRLEDQLGDSLLSHMRAGARQYGSRVPVPA